MRHARSISLLAGLAVLAVAPTAHAFKPRPVVKKVTPLNAAVGDTITVKGRFFRPGRYGNTVVFMRKGKVVYVRADLATGTSMTITLPKRLEKLLASQNGRKLASRFRVKVIAKKMGRVAKRKRARPLIGPDVGGDCDNDGIPNSEDPDDDNDGLPDWLEIKIKTDPCNRDTDGDGLLDSWEYYSAIDLNSRFLPYPGKRPYPNALHADANVDYDGDGLLAWQEHAMWYLGGQKIPLDYSDGNQRTKPEPVGAHWWLDLDGDGVLSDDERDFDKDGLGNAVEALSFTFMPWGYPATFRPNFLDRDTDGDGLADGWDDQDHDDVSNVEEIINGTWAMNPCDPNPNSRTCPRWRENREGPAKPEHVCLSTTLLTGSVKWYEYTKPEQLDADELAKFCHWTNP